MLTHEKLLELMARAQAFETARASADPKQLAEIAQASAAIDSNAPKTTSEGHVAQVATEPAAVTSVEESPLQKVPRLPLSSDPSCASSS